MLGYLLVAAGAAVGAPLRYLTDRAAQSRLGPVFPWGTLAVNVLGSLVLGVVAGVTMDAPGSDLRLLIGTGFCGALTTYSTLSWETVRLLERGDRLLAAANMGITVLAGLGAVVLGYAVGTVR
jgi:CrcB protein